MSKASKIWLVVAASLVALGIIIFGVVMSMLEWNFAKLSTVKYETNIYEIGEDFHNISIKTDTSDVTLLLSDDGKVKVECYESEKEKHSVTVENDTLIVDITNDRKWYDYIGIGVGGQKITVYLPASEYGSLNIKDSTGDIKVDDLCVSSMELSVTTGDIEISDIKCRGDIKIGVITGKMNVKNVECKNLTSSGSTGDTDMTGVIAKEKLDIKRTTGDVNLDGCDAGELCIKVTTGDVKGSLLSEKVFAVKTSTGDKDVPKTTSGGLCEITTTTGDIIITIK